MLIGRGQSAVEFVTIYGFVFLVIAIALSILFLYYSIPRTIIPSSCDFYSGFACSDAAFGTNSVNSTTPQLVILASDTEPGIVNVSSFNAVLDTQQSVSGHCTPNTLTAGQYTLCYATFNFLPSPSQVYSGTFAMTANYCAPAPSNVSTAFCPQSDNFTFSGSIRLQPSSTNDITLPPAPSPPPVSAGPREYVWVGDAYDHAMPVVYTGNYTEVNSIYYYGFSNDGPVAFSNKNTAWAAGFFGDQYAINTGNYEVTTYYEPQLNPYGPTYVAASPNGTEVYFAANNDIYVLSTATNTITNIYASPSYDDFAQPLVSPNSQNLYLAGQQSGNIYTMAASTGAITNTITGVFTYPSSLPYADALSPNGGYMYVASTTGNVYTISTSTDTVTNVISFGPSAIVTGMAASPNGHQLCAAFGYGGINALAAIINTGTDTVANEVPLNSIYTGPYSCAFSNNSHFFYLAMRQNPGVLMIYSDTTFMPVNAVVLNHIYPSAVIVQP